MFSRYLRLPAATWFAIAATAAAVSAAELPRVRALDPHAAELIRRARIQSATVRDLEQTLAASDLVAYVRCAWMTPGQPDGTLRWVSATPQLRYVLVTIGLDLPLGRRIEMLGHELHHATEVASAPWVRSPGGMRSLFSQIGRRTSQEGTYETDAARDTERRVRRDMGEALGPPPARPGSPG